MKYKELTDALVRLQTNSESSSPIELTRTLLVTGMSEKEAWKLQDEENYSNINGLGYAKRARAHLLRDLAKWENWENDDDFLEERYELAGHDFSICLYTKSIELYGRALSLRQSSERPAEAKEIDNIPQPSPPIPMVEAVGQPKEITNESLSISVSTSPLEPAVTDVSRGTPREEEVDVNQRQQVTRGAAVSQPILHYSTTSPREKTIIINKQNTPINNRELTAMPRLDIGLIHRSIWAIAMDIKDGNSSLYQNYKCLRVLTESAMIILLDRGYSYREIYSHISLKCTALLKLKSASAISNIFKIVSGLMQKDSANLINILRQRRRQFQLRSLLRRVESATYSSPQETAPDISLTQPQPTPSIGVIPLVSIDYSATAGYYKSSLSSELTRHSIEISPQACRLSIMSLCPHRHCLLCAYHSFRKE